MRCSSCDRDNPDDAKFCVACGNRFATRCANCGSENPSDANFCKQCGALLGDKRERSRSVTDEGRISITAGHEENAALDGERKTVTALFADIKGSTELEQDLDPEEARAIIDPALKLMIDAVRRYDGYIVQSTGDGIFGLFGAPVAHEDHPQRALHAALRIHDENRRYADQLRVDGRPPLQIRIGVDTGEVVLRSIETGGKTEYTPIGHTANLASRMQSLANPGSTVISESMRKLVEGYFALKSLGASRVKGIAGTVNVYEVTGLGPLRTRLQRSAARGYTKFVGREREMDAMKAAAEQVKAGHGQIVAAVAEPGVGKSRLIFEFKATSESGWMALEGFSVSHGKASAFLPVIDLLWRYFKITSDDDERTRREKATGRVLALDRSLEDALPYLYGLLGLTDDHNQLAEIEAQTRKRRSLDATKRILLRESLNQPLMLIFEDLHWIDDETQAFLNLLADSIGTARILLLVNYRPEYRHEWGHKTYYTQLRLDPLGKESAAEMLQFLLGDTAELAPLKRLIIEKTEGTPLFMEEVVDMLLDEGTLVRDGSIKIVKPLAGLKIPPTVQDILAGRIDRLLPAEKDLLQTLAVIGREFALGLVQRVLQKSEAELNHMLYDLQFAEFIYEQPAVGDIEYTFKHALTHDVAYKSLLSERRQLLHERIGAALESMHAGSLDDHVAELAHHYVRSNNASKAAEYCLRACDRCSQRMFFAEAIAYFEAGLKALQRLPDPERRAELELDLRIATATAIGMIKGFGSADYRKSSARAVELSQRPNISWERTWSALFTASTAVLGLDVGRACRVCADLVTRAQEHGNPEQIGTAVVQLSLVSTLAGDFDFAAKGFARGTALLGTIPTSPTKEFVRYVTAASYYRVSGRAVWGYNLWMLGYIDRARAKLDEAIAFAREFGSKSDCVYAHYIAMAIFALSGDLERARKSAQETLALATELGDAPRGAMGEAILAWTQTSQEDLAGGIDRLQRSLALIRTVGAEGGIPWLLSLIATAFGKMGNFEEANRTIDESISMTERIGERNHEAEVHRLKGELLLAQDASNAAQAQQSFRTAIEISRKQHAKSWELRATTSLARLLAKQGERDEARAMLAEIYNWFTEGFDTADLKDAKALLDELK